jgi:hypothetical protein
MANVQITQLPAASGLTGTESVPIVQNGRTVQTTTGAIATGSIGNYTFLTVNNEPNLPNSRYFSTDANLTITDGGAQSFYRISLNGAAAQLNLISNGIVVKTGVSTLASRSIDAGSGIAVTNSNGVSGNPTISLSTSGVTAGTYFLSNFTVDSFGRITSTSPGLTTGTGSVVLNNNPVFDTDIEINGISYGTGSIDVGEPKESIAIGNGTLASNTLGIYNIALGYQALTSNEDGNQNIALGYQALAANTYTSHNIALGYQSLLQNTGGTYNIATGYQALGSNSSGSYNVALGFISLLSNTTGNNNHAIGSNALRGNTTGSNNNALGASALANNTTGIRNIATGTLALGLNSTGSDNVGLGYQAMYLGTTGSFNVALGYAAMAQTSTGSSNTAVGAGTLLYNRAGIENTAVGAYALYAYTKGINPGLTTGNYNSALGVGALFANAGDYNTGVGYEAGNAITTGSYNVVIGSYDGNMGGLDIRTSNNNVVLSDGEGNIRLYINTSGAISVAGASNFGTAGQVLTSNGNAAAPTWQAGGGSMVYPGAGIPNSTGSAWGTSYSVTGTGSVVLSDSPTFAGTALTVNSTNTYINGGFDVSSVGAPVVINGVGLELNTSGDGDTTIGNTSSGYATNINDDTVTFYGNNITFTGNASINSGLVVSGQLALNGSATVAQNIATNQTSGTLAIGGASGTGGIVFGRSTVTQAVNMGTGATASGSTKTVNIGTNGVAGSTNNINIGNVSTGGGTLTFGQATGTQTTNIQAGATASGSTKTLNIGTGGLAGSTTNIIVGSTAGTSTTTLNGSVTALKNITVNGLNVGTGDGNVATNTAYGFDAIGSSYITSGNINNVGIGYNALNGIGAGVATVTQLTAGSGYDSGYDGETVPLIYVSGTPIQAGGTYPTLFININGSGEISSGSIVNKGFGWSALDTVFTLDNSSIGGVGSGATFQIASLAPAVNNTAIGYNAGNTQKVGSNSVHVGYNTSGTGSNQVLIGYNITGITQDNVVVIGDTNITNTTLRGNVTATQFTGIGSFTNLSANGSLNLTGNAFSSASFATSTTGSTIGIGTSLTGGSLNIGSNSQTGAINMGRSNSSGTIVIGGTTGTGAITLGQSTANQTVNIATGANTSGTKTLNLGTAGGVGGTTTIAIGTTAGTSTTTLNGINNYPSLTASQAVFTDASKNLVSVATTGTGSVVLSSSSAPSGAIVGISDTQTLTNKRITPRVSTTTSSATPTINTDTTDQYGLTAQAVDITSFTTNLSGTPTDGQKLWIYIVGTAARAITWGASFEASTVALPTTTVTTNRLDVGFVWNAATSKWRCVAVA